MRVEVADGDGMSVGVNVAVEVGPAIANLVGAGVASSAIDGDIGEHALQVSARIARTKKIVERIGTSNINRMEQVAGRKTQDQWLIPVAWNL